MADAPERLWLWPAEPEGGADKCVSFPNQPYPSGSTEYIRADVARADAELAVAEAIRRAAQEAHDWFYDPEHDRVTDPRLGEAILDLAPADALAELQRIRAERDAALARVEKLHHLITEASDPDFIWGAMDSVNDAENPLDDYASAVSRAIRAAMQIKGDDA